MSSASAAICTMIPQEGASTKVANNITPPTVAAKGTARHAPPRIAKAKTTKISPSATWIPARAASPLGCAASTSAGMKKLKDSKSRGSPAILAASSALRVSVMRAKTPHRSAWWLMDNRLRSIQVAATLARTIGPMQNIRAEILLPTQELRDDIPFFTKSLGMRMDGIFPADDPTEAVFSGHGLRLRIRKGADVPPGVLRILADDPLLIAGGATELTAPNGTRVEIASLAPPVVMPETKHEFTIRRMADQAPWVIGRAGMHYRDLIPSRLGGSIIASHIRIPDGGPVPDMVHFHSVGFQLIFCYRGWVDLVYEDQGEAFRLHAGNCVIQPPEIRHRVLFASDMLEVIEIGLPADHVTTIDHDMDLPNGQIDRDRRWAGQRFVHNQAADAAWDRLRPGYDARDTTISENTAGVADVLVARPNGETPTSWSHDDDIYFVFVMAGSARLGAECREGAVVSEGDAFVVPPGLAHILEAPSPDLELLEVRLPKALRG